MSFVLTIDTTFHLWYDEEEKKENEGKKPLFRCLFIVSKGGCFMVYGYARVSTIGQGAHGNSIADQIAKLKEAGAEEIAQDTFTGTRLDRPAFSDLLARLHAGDKLIVTKLDRFARSAVEGVQTVTELLQRGVIVHVLNMGTVDDTPIGRLTLTIMLAFAEFERDMIIERTQSGKAVARAQGKRVDGRPAKYTPRQIINALEMLENGHSYTEVVELTGISKSTLIRAKRKKQLL